MKRLLLLFAVVLVCRGGLFAAGAEVEERKAVFEPLIVAHRGASKDAPENTIAAFELAWKQRADAIEADFQLTKDGYIVCIHDKNTKKVAGTNLVVKESTLKQLRALDVGLHHSEAYKGSMIPTISEVFSTVPEKKKIYIEIKCGSEIIDQLIVEIKKSGLKREQIVMICFDNEVVKKFKKKAPQFKAVLLVSFKRNKFGRITPSGKTVMKDLAKSKADGLSSSKERVSEELIKKVLASGYEYHVWTVDDVKTAKRFKGLGALSITTNVAGIMKQRFAKEKKQLKIVEVVESVVK